MKKNCILYKIVYYPFIHATIYDCSLKDGSWDKKTILNEGDRMIYLFPHPNKLKNKIFLHIKSGKLVDCNEHYYEIV